MSNFQNKLEHQIFKLTKLRTLKNQQYIKSLQISFNKLDMQQSNYDL